MKSIREQDRRHGQQSSERDQPRSRRLLRECKPESRDADCSDHDLPFPLDPVGDESDEQRRNRKEGGDKETVLQALNKAGAAGLHQGGWPIVKTEKTNGLKENQKHKHDRTTR